MLLLRRVLFLFDLCLVSHVNGMGLIDLRTETRLGVGLVTGQRDLSATALFKARSFAAPSWTLESRFAVPVFPLLDALLRAVRRSSHFSSRMLLRYFSRQS